MTTVTLPKWLRKMPKEEQAQARSRFLLRLAALYATEEGSLRQLSILLENSPNTLGAYAKRDEAITPPIAIRIEKLLGADLFPRSLLRPDHFVAGK